MKIIITEQQYKVISERLDYSVGDIPARGTSRIPSRDEYIGKSNDYNKKLKQSTISDDEDKINKVRSKLISIYDSYVDKIIHLEKWNKEDKKLNNYKEKLDQIRELMGDKEELLKLYGKFSSEEEYVARKDNHSPDDYDTVKRQTDDEIQKKEEQEKKSKIETERLRLKRIIKQNEDKLKKLSHEKREFIDKLLGEYPKNEEDRRTRSAKFDEYVEGMNILIDRLESNISTAQFRLLKLPN